MVSTQKKICNKIENELQMYLYSKQLFTFNRFSIIKEKDIDTVVKKPEINIVD